MADEKKIPGPGETPAPESHEPETPGPLPMGRVLFRALPIETISRILIMCM